MKAKIHYNGHQWYITDDSSLGKNYFKLIRVSFKSDLKKYGMVASAIDVHKSNFKEETNER